MALASAISTASLAENLTPLQFEVVEPEVAAPGADDRADDAPAWRVYGELRQRATWRSNVEFDPENDAENGLFWTQRLSVGGDARIAPWLGAHATLLSALQEGIAASPIENNSLDLQEAWLSIGPGGVDARGGHWLRIGRQELVLGAQRLVGSRNGTNVKRTWDGLRASLDVGAWNVQALGLREVRVQTNGLFNDDSSDGPRLAGVYASGPARATGNVEDGTETAGPPGVAPRRVGRLDAYYLFAAFDARTTVEGTAEQSRHTLGLRSFGEAGAWFWNWEGMYQFGRHGSADIAAWSVAANTGHRFDDAPWRPELLLSTNVASGDGRSDDGRLGTFDALFARGSYFSELALLAPSNFFNVHPYLKVHPRADMLAFVDVNFYWRLRESDGVYVNPGRLLRAPSGSRERFVNLSVSAGVEWEPRDALFLSLLYTHAAPQAFIEETGPPAAAIDFLEFTVRLRF